LFSRADIWRTAAKQYVEARETRAVSHTHESSISDVRVIDA